MRVGSVVTPLLLSLLLAACAETAPEMEEPLGVATSALSVGDAIDTSCSTASVRGLSLQIIAKAACIEPDAYTEVPALPNVTFVDTVFPYLEAPARDAFVAAAQAHPNSSLTVNSMLRTVAQQVLLYEWYQSGRCGIGLAATPGNSNHETGLAMDISQYQTWRPYLEAEGFSWLGSSDPVHFDYTGPGAQSYKGVDVLAFQMLWNEHHPEDPIAEDGAYGPMTRARVLAAPADGFAGEVVCDAPPADAPQLTLGASFPGADDRFADGASTQVPDLFEGDAASAAVEIVNDGAAAAGDVVLAIAVDDALPVAALRVDRSVDGTSWSPDTIALPAPSARFELALGALAPGEHRRVGIDLKDLAYSVDTDAAPAVKAWVVKLDERYAQAEFGGEVTSDGSQTFGGGRLQVAGAADVYARTRWEWNSDRREGASAPSPAALSVELGSLRVSGLEAGAVLALPALDPAPSGALTAVIVGRREGAGGATLLVAAPGESIAEAGARVDLAWPADGADHTLEIPLDGAPIGQLGLVFETAPAALALDAVRLEGPGAADGGGGGDAADGDDSGLTGACSCRLGAPAAGPLGASGLLLMLFGLLRRRAARRPARE